jgi:uncharacterized membrane protein
MARVARIHPLTALWAAIAAYAIGFAALSILRHEAFSTGRFDLGNMTQAVWSTAHGHPLRVTSLAGDQISRLGSHVDPILVVFAPLWWLWPSPNMLLTAQAAAIALGALPVYRLAIRHLGSDRAGLAFGLTYLVYPATTWLTLDEFHPVALATPLLLFAIDALDADRLRAFAAFAIPAALTKEEVALVVAALGIWYALARGRHTAGWTIAALGFAWTAFATTVVIPHFADGGGAFYGRYREVGGSAGGIARTAVTDPWRLLEVAFDGDGVRYLLALVLPLAGLCLLSPISLVAVPELALNLLSSTKTQQSIHFHYVAGVIPPLVAGTILGARRLRERRALPVATIALAAALVGNFALGAIPAWRVLPGGSRAPAHDLDVTAHDRVAERGLAVIPDGAVVSATNSLGAHLSTRRRILSFPMRRDATWLAVDETRLSYRDSLTRKSAARASLRRLRRDPAWRLVFDEDGVLVFRREPRA